MVNSISLDLMVLILLGTKPTSQRGWEHSAQTSWKDFWSNGQEPWWKAVAGRVHWGRKVWPFHRPVIAVRPQLGPLSECTMRGERKKRLSLIFSLWAHHEHQAQSESRRTEIFPFCSFCERTPNIRHKSKLLEKYDVSLYPRHLLT